MNSLPPSFSEDLTTATGFRAGRMALGLSRKQLSRVLGTSFDTIKKWETEGPKSFGPNPVASTAMSWMIHDGYRPQNFPETKTEACDESHNLEDHTGEGR